ncbi:hypothetical protein PUR21_21795 [Methylorubrum rhodesianum]|uniref:Uncharacterized protein n=1 Tax=Methylorubrum rhodesianum TaxID=29427 RepID=A0ABU9ZGX6_9HYPH
MSLINLTQEEKTALDGIDERELDRHIDEALRSGRPDGLRRLPLGRCGPFVSGRLRNYEQALSRFHEAKSAAKSARTEQEARRAGYDLSHAVSQMKHRRDEEEREGKLFHVEDRFIHHPLRPGRRMSVTVGYRWRRSEEDPWNDGHITFEHAHDPRPDYVREASRPKPGTARRQREEEDELHRVWERLRDSALFSVRDFFRGGGDGGEIPRTFQVTVDAYHRTLNNHSTKFWLDKPGRAERSPGEG